MISCRRRTGPGPPTGNGAPRLPSEARQGLPLPDERGERVADRTYAVDDGAQRPPVGSEVGVVQLGRCPRRGVDVGFCDVIARKAGVRCKSSAIAGRPARPGSVLSVRPRITGTAKPTPENHRSEQRRSRDHDRPPRQAVRDLRPHIKAAAELIDRGRNIAAELLDVPDLRIGLPGDLRPQLFRCRRAAVDVGQIVPYRRLPEAGLRPLIHRRSPPALFVPTARRLAMATSGVQTWCPAGQTVGRPLSLSRTLSISPTPGPTILWNTSLLGAAGCGRVGATFFAVSTCSRNLTSCSCGT